MRRTRCRRHRCCRSSRASRCDRAPARRAVPHRSRSDDCQVGPAGVMLRRNSATPASSSFMRRLRPRQLVAAVRLDRPELLEVAADAGLRRDHACAVSSSTSACCVSAGATQQQLPDRLAALLLFLAGVGHGSSRINMRIYYQNAHIRQASDFAFSAICGYTARPRDPRMS